VILLDSIIPSQTVHVTFIPTSPSPVPFARTVVFVMLTKPEIVQLPLSQSELGESCCLNLPDWFTRKSLSVVSVTFVRLKKPVVVMFSWSTVMLTSSQDISVEMIRSLPGVGVQVLESAPLPAAASGSQSITMLPAFDRL